MFWKLFSSIFLQFLTHYLIPSSTNFITNRESVSGKNARYYLLVFWNVRKRQLANIGWNQQNFKNCVVLLKFYYPKYSQFISKLISLASLNVEFYHFAQNNQNLCFCKIFVFVNFPLHAHCVRRVRGKGGWIFYCLECKAGIHSCISTSNTLEVIQSWSYFYLFSSLATIPVQQDRFLEHRCWKYLRRLLDLLKGCKI